MQIQPWQYRIRCPEHKSLNIRCLVENQWKFWKGIHFCWIWYYSKCSQIVLRIDCGIHVGMELIDTMVLLHLLILFNTGLTIAPQPVGLYDKFLPDNLGLIKIVYAVLLHYYLQLVYKCIWIDILVLPRWYRANSVGFAIRMHEILVGLKWHITTFRLLYPANPVLV